MKLLPVLDRIFLVWSYQYIPARIVCPLIGCGHSVYGYVNTERKVFVARGFIPIDRR